MSEPVLNRPELEDFVALMTLNGNSVFENRAAWETWFTMYAMVCELHDPNAATFL